MKEPNLSSDAEATELLRRTIVELEGISARLANINHMLPRMEELAQVYISGRMAAMTYVVATMLSELHSTYLEAFPPYRGGGAP